MEEESASEGTADPHQKPENESGREGQSKFGPAGEHSKTDLGVDLESHQGSVAQTDTWMNDNRFIRAALRCGIDVTTLIPQEPLDFFRQGDTEAEALQRYERWEQERQRKVAMVKAEQANVVAVAHPFGNRPSSSSGVIEQSWQVADANGEDATSPGPVRSSSASLLKHSHPRMKDQSPAPVASVVTPSSRPKSSPAGRRLNDAKRHAKELETVMYDLVRAQVCQKRIDEKLRRAEARLDAASAATLDKRNRRLARQKQVQRELSVRLSESSLEMDGARMRVQRKREATEKCIAVAAERQKLLHLRRCTEGDLKRKAVYEEKQRLRRRAEFKRQQMHVWDAVTLPASLQYPMMHLPQESFAEKHALAAARREQARPATSIAFGRSYNVFKEQWREGRHDSPLLKEALARLKATDEEDNEFDSKAESLAQVARRRVARISAKAKMDVHAKAREMFDRSVSLYAPEAVQNIKLRRHELLDAHAAQFTTDLSGNGVVDQQSTDRVSTEFLSKASLHNKLNNELLALLQLEASADRRHGDSSSYLQSTERIIQLLGTQSQILTDPQAAIKSGLLVPPQASEELLELRAALRRKLLHAPMLFSKMDANRDNCVDFHEFKVGLQAAGVHCSSSSIDELFREFDVDGSGSISWLEMKEALLEGEKRKHRNEVKVEKRVVQHRRNRFRSMIGVSDSMGRSGGGVI